MLGNWQSYRDGVLLQRPGNFVMNKDKNIVFGIVLLALFCSSLPIITLLVMGSGSQHDTVWDQIPQQLDQPTIFASMTLTKLMNGALFIPVIGLALSLYYQRRNRTKFQLTTASFTLFLLGTVLFAVLSTGLEIQYNQQAVLVEQRAAGYASLNCVSTLVNILSWTILLVAIFSPKFNTNNENPDKK